MKIRSVRADRAVNTTSNLGMERAERTEARGIPSSGLKKEYLQGVSNNGKNVTDAVI
jgi:hypothetical protein